ncbi:hypothetical protein BDY24DRAFT_433716 [Mrakia frigida]|uniref:HNH endonuclease family protein n=1 Tax=Mrakia frigida TaxID=29902 RepID=UPI003FCBF191
MHLSSLLLSLSALALGVQALPAPTVVRRTAPAPVSVASAKTLLAGLTVKAEANSATYNRDLFPHWITQSGACNTRETALKRDGTGVVVSSACAATSGTWVSPYDGATWTAASDVDIDHMVPLSEAWASGASAWTTAQRQAFANDLVRPQLFTVTDNVNQSKGDKDPAEWMPPLASYHCIYVRSWIQVKSYYGLSIDTAEKAALTNYINAC